MTFHYIHYSADNAYEYYNKEEIDQNLCHASSDALQQQYAFVDEGE